MCFSVYEITNQVNGKKYVGYTQFDVEGRFCQHIAGALTNGPLSNTPLSKDIHKYGYEKFVCRILATNIESEEKAKKVEDYYIDKLNSHILRHGYNSAFCAKNVFEGARYADEYSLDSSPFFALNCIIPAAYDNKKNHAATEGYIDPRAYFGAMSNTAVPLQQIGFARLGGGVSPVSNLDGFVSKPKQRLFHNVDNSLPYSEYKRRCAVAAA